MMKRPDRIRVESRPAKWRHRLCCVSAAALLAACGGGGSDPPPPPTTYALKTAMMHMLTDTGAWTLTGVGSDAAHYTVNMSIAPLPAAAFPVSGPITARSQHTLAVQREGVATGSTTQTIHFDGSSLAFVGWVYDDASCSVATSNTALPTSAVLGASGAMFSQSDFDTCSSSATAMGTSTNRWSIEADGGVVLLCWNVVAQDLGGTTNGTLSQCVELAADGSLRSKARFAISAAGFSVTTRNY